MSRFLRLWSAVSIAALLGTGLPAFAGTTGALSGVVSDDAKAPVAGARVTVTSPSQTSTVTTDAGGHFAFVSLAPDEYTIAVMHAGYDNASLSGVAVFADASQVVGISLRKALKTIATVTSRSAGDLVRSGTTADVYSVNAAQQARTNVLGGGGNLNSAYSAISAVPGAYVPTNQSGYNQAVHVRGGDSSEVGYEFDGIPVNRAFDNYPSGSASSLGQLELQVYTGAAPADAEAQGLAGFINQVIKSGTAPGYGSFDVTAGTPTFYHSLQFETGGATPDRRFSYYVGVGGFNQDHRYIDQNNGSSYADVFGPPVGYCASAPLPANSPASCYTNGAPNISAEGAPASGGYILGPMPFGNDAAGVTDRTSVINLHLAVPHRDGGLRDDIQLLYDNDSIQTPLYVSALDEGLNNLGGAVPSYTDSFQYTGAPGTFLSDANASQVTPYLYPSSPQNRALYAPIPLTSRDVQYNDQAIFKLQYQHALSSDAFLRVYGYTYYSDYNAAGAVSSWQPITGLDSGDYELNSHTRGVSASFVKQFGAKHLVQAEASYVTATSLRMNSDQIYGGADAFAVVVNPNDLTSGTCFSLGGAGGAATATSCSNNALTVATPATFASLAGTYAATQASGTPTVADASGNPLTSSVLSTYSCNGGPCALYTVENGQSGKYNTVRPVFTGYSLSDEWRPSEKLLVNAGLRLDTYKYQGDDTTGTAARAFWFNAFNHDTCYDTQNLTLYDKTSLESGGSIPIASDCSAAGSQYTNAFLNNASNQTFTYTNFQPRIGVTYTLSPDTVLRGSFGKYIEQPSAAYEQYDSLAQNLPAQLIGFYSLGFNTPGHEVRPAVSYNADFSLEHHFKGSDMSVKVTPFFRQTHDQIENFYLNIKQGFISGLNAGKQTSRGFEFAFTKGSFDRDGFAAQLGFAYTYADLKFNQLPNGTTVLSPINADISNYNAYSKDCQAGGALSGKSQYGVPLCGTLPGGETAAPCYTTSGAADPSCLPGSIANPYWNAPGQSLLDPNASYLPYSTIPGGIGTGVNAYTYPYVASLILQWKSKKLAITPSFQYVAGNRYGAPETTPGIDPATCTAALSSTIGGDPRYPYGAPGGSPYNAANCASGPVIPDPYTSQFDGLGAFREPAQLLGHLRVSYDFSSHVSANVTFANVLSTCFGGQQTAFTYYQNKNACSYGPVLNGYESPIGNAYNPSDNVQTVLRYPYEPVFGTYNDLTSSTLSPFSMYFNLKIRL
ncbi:MAG: TonB-dependent receptor [Candidatus Eremiobacteraeota bacterium]|nr:TonB-dependent receptor [Candidatus Eremiobacteraeota bacterium]